MNAFYALLEIALNLPSLIISEIMSLFGMPDAAAMEFGWYIQILIYITFFVFIIFSIIRKVKSKGAGKM